jgi:hypothetical protein
MHLSHIIFLFLFASRPSDRHVDCLVTDLLVVMDLGGDIDEFQVTREDVLALSQDADWLGVVGVLYLPLVDLPDPPSGQAQQYWQSQL